MKKTKAVEARDTKVEPKVVELTGKAAREQAFNHICAQLSEFFDSSFVIVTWTEEGQTNKIERAMGNNYAVTGMLQDASERYVACDITDEDGEEWKHA